MTLELNDLYVGRRDFRLGPINQELSSGDLIVVRGSNGSGKTTLLSTIAGLIPPISGVVSVDGKDPAHAFLTGRPQATFIPDDPSIVLGNFTAYEFWTMIAALAGRSGMQRSEVEKARKRWQGVLRFRPPKHAKISSFSHGMVKKTQLIAGLQIERSVLVLDEPSNGLDHESWSRLLTELVARRGESITVLSSHELKALEVPEPRHIWDVDRWTEAEAAL